MSRLIRDLSLSPSIATYVTGFHWKPDDTGSPNFLSGEPVSSGFQWKPVTYVAIEGDKLKSLVNLLNELDNDEDVQQVFSNFEASDEELAKFA